MKTIPFKPICAAILVLVFAHVSYAQHKNGKQNNNETIVDEEIYSFVEEMPSFPGGDLYGYINANLKYPKIAKENGIQGKVVVQFVIGANGNIDTSSVIALNSLGWGLEQEAIRVVSTMPPWIPGKENGKNVKVKFTIPILFRMD